MFFFFFHFSGRIVDSDESEYDSELDDFIDDGPDETDNYSKYIQDIFGYDKNRYRDEDIDDREMESTFAQQMREEFVSKKIGMLIMKKMYFKNLYLRMFHLSYTGLMEDLEDMRQEALEKQRKAQKIKKK